MDETIASMDDAVREGASDLGTLEDLIEEDLMMEDFQPPHDQLKIFHRQDYHISRFINL